jgi:hypothetical protein
MKTIRVSSWDCFDKALEQVRREYGPYRRKLPDGQVFQPNVGILFRGQADHRWKLETTLERRTSAEYDIGRYLARATSAVNELESFTGAKWNVPSWQVLEQEIKDKSGVSTVHLPAYDYLVYLRHHGYPSPLLDWTESPYIAAYFAYLNAKKNNPAVYCYIERPQLWKDGTGGVPMISLKGPYVSTDKRHFAQKAWYTLSTCWDCAGKRHVFCPHERIFEKNDQRQDALVKLVLPVGDRIAALGRLSDYNINHFTLFQSEDSLVKALESKHFDQIDAS